MQLVRVAIGSHLSPFTNSYVGTHESPTKKSKLNKKVILHHLDASQGNNERRRVSFGSKSCTFLADRMRLTGSLER